jgi:hypothetical protein
MPDFNGDNVPDLVVAFRGSTLLHVYQGNADGTFHYRQSFPVGRDAHSVVVADVNGDNVLDLVVANLDRETVGVLLGNGDGSFRHRDALSAETFPFLVEGESASGDSKLALASANRDAAGHQLPGDGDGTFQTQNAGTQTAFPLAAADLTAHSKSPWAGRSALLLGDGLLGEPGLAVLPPAGLGLEMLLNSPWLDSLFADAPALSLPAPAPAAPAPAVPEVLPAAPLVVVVTLGPSPLVVARGSPSASTDSSSAPVVEPGALALSDGETIEGSPVVPAPGQEANEALRRLDSHRPGPPQNEVIPSKEVPDSPAAGLASWLVLTHFLLGSARKEPFGDRPRRRPWGNATRLIC